MFITFRVEMPSSPSNRERRPRQIRASRGHPMTAAPIARPVAKDATTCQSNTKGCNDLRMAQRTWPPALPGDPPHIGTWAWLLGDHGPVPPENKFQERTAVPRNAQVLMTCSSPETTRARLS